jgi:uncharacterized protein (DUF58 family)
MRTPNQKSAFSAVAEARDPRIAVSLKQLRALEFEARGFSFKPQQPVRSVLSGKYRSRLRGRGLDFEELRHYQPGDDIRTMDWKVTNRTGKPHVRVYTEERERSVQLVVDQRMSMFFGSRRAMKSVVAAEIAALAAWRVLASGDRIGGVIFDDQHCHSLTPRRSRESVMALLGRLQKTNAALRPGLPSSPEQLNHALDTLTRRLSHDALVIYIGDGHGWDARSEQLVKRISLHNDFVAVNVYDPAERKLPALDTFVVSDGEMQVSISGKSRQLQERFRDAYREDMGRMGQVLQRYGVAVIPVDTVKPPVQQLLHALGASPR